MRADRRTSNLIANKYNKDFQQIPQATSRTLTTFDPATKPSKYAPQDQTQLTTSMIMNREIAKPLSFS